MVLDSLIVFGFLALVLYWGFVAQGNIKNFQDFTLGGRRFSNHVLISSLAATLASGEVLTLTVHFSYAEGFWHEVLVGSCPSLVGSLIIAYFVAPRTKKIFGQLSIAETMGRMYGPGVRFVTAFISFFACVGVVAFQIKLTQEFLCEVLPEGPLITALVLGITLLLITYAALGGVISVAYTDVIQFLAVVIILPCIALYLLGQLGGETARILVDAPIIPGGRTTSWLYACGYVLLAIMCTDLDPAGFQRVLMARNEQQVKKIFIWAGILLLLLQFLFAFLGHLTWLLKPELSEDGIITYLFSKLSHPGFKGIFTVCMLGLIMSTADSYLNTGAVIWVNDLAPFIPYKKWRLAIDRHKLAAARYATGILGLLAMVLALLTTRLIALCEIFTTLYFPVVIIPLCLNFFGFRTIPRVAFISMLSTLLFISGWMLLCDYIVDPESEGKEMMIFFPAVVFHLVVLFGGHYASGAEGGWREKNFWYPNIGRILRYLWRAMARYEVTQERGIWMVGALFVSQGVCYTLPASGVGLTLWLRWACLFVITLGFGITSAYVWFGEDRKWQLKGELWHAMAYVTLVVAPSLMFFLSYAQRSFLFMNMINFFVLARVVHFPAAVVMACTGVPLAWGVVSLFVPEADYALFVWQTVPYVGMGVIMLGFAVLSKVETYNFNAKMLAYTTFLNCRLDERDELITSFQEAQQQFLYNVAHSLNKPLNNLNNALWFLTSVPQKEVSPQKLWEGIEAIRQHYKEWLSFSRNIVQYAELSVKPQPTRVKAVNLNKVIEQAVETWRTLCPGQQGGSDTQGDIILNLKPLRAKAREDYVGQILENLLMNASVYGGGSLLNISVVARGAEVWISVSDRGIGIREDELEHIFKPFEVSSFTRSRAGNRGMGLALCRRLAESMGGSLEAECREGITTLTLRLPKAL